MDSTLVRIQGQTGGIGQGGGAGPLSWIAVIDIMLKAYRKLGKGAMVIDPLQLYSICYWLISYVDDNTIVVSFEDEEDQGEMLRTIRMNLGIWRRLLQITGGDIDVEKSKWCTLRWKYSRGWGIPALEDSKDFPGEVGMKSIQEGRVSTQTLERLEPRQAERILGVQIPMDGNMTVEYKFRCTQIKEFGGKIRAAPISHIDAWMIYESRYRPKIRYPLPVTTFTDTQCDNIQMLNNTNNL